jgi:hypothetical protein
MSVHATTGFRRAGFALATIAGLAMASAAHAQTAPRPLPVNAPPASTVPHGQCTAFGSYVLDEDDAFPGKLSSTFLNTVSRFVAAKCATRDDKGEIQIITMNNQDAASFSTALRRMGKFDLIGVSGVKGCARPPGGICPSTTSSNPPPRVGG